jgi:hypothetical protein|tara:strand:+ start:6545 stop:6694 length:150 start_codon:yes stop_codon:yes gene_type:complete
MGEWLSNNILLPIMYLLIDLAIGLGIVLLAMHLLEMILNNKIFKNIRRR